MTLFQNYILIIAWLVVYPLASSLNRLVNDKVYPERKRSEARVADFIDLVTFVIVLVCIVKAGPA